jgi:lysophospholipase L1-like esterase
VTCLGYRRKQDVVTSRPCRDGAFAVAIVLLEVRMKRSGSRRPATAQHGLRRAAALAVAAVAVAGCQAAAAGAAASRSTSPSGARSTSPRTARPSPSSPVPVQPTGQSPRIMVVGDSITEGSAGDYTWQYRLYEHLRADGVTPRMVGPYHSLFNNVTKTEGDQNYANPGFEHANDATWGMTLSHEKDAIGGRVATYRPDYLLVLLGLDDLFWFGTSQPDMAADLAAFIAAARTVGPHIRIVFGLLPPNIHTQTNPVFAASVAGFNHTISSTAARLSTPGSPVTVARDGAGLNVASDLWDGTHPNANGEVKIAAAFADILASRFHLGSTYARPYPVLPTGPLTQSLLTVKPSQTARQAKLSWTPVPGADSYRVFVKDVTQGEVTFSRLPWPLTAGQDRWTAGLLNSGDTYDFKLQACKGVDCGVFSNVASVTTP